MAARDARVPIVALAVHLAAVMIWLGVLVAVGGAAAIAFHEMKRLSPIAPGFEIPAEEHWRIVGGHFAAPMFVVGDIAGAALGLVAVIAMIVGFRATGVRTPWRTRLHTAAFGIAVGVFLFQLLVLSPRMRSNLDEYWSLARAGNVVPAAAARARFDADHPVASRVLGTLAMALLASGVGAVARIGAIGRIGEGAATGARRMARGGLVAGSGQTEQSPPIRPQNG